MQTLGQLCGGAAAFIGATLLVRKPVQAALTPYTRFAMHPAGPFYIHFWAPNFKWALSINNLIDYDRPVEKISLSMNSALTLTGCLFMRWSFVITPVNYSLFFVNAALASSSGYHLARKCKYEFMDKK